MYSKIVLSIYMCILNSYNKSVLLSEIFGKNPIIDNPFDIIGILKVSSKIIHYLYIVIKLVN